MSKIYFFSKLQPITEQILGLFVLTACIFHTEFKYGNENLNCEFFFKKLTKNAMSSTSDIHTGRVKDSGAHDTIILIKLLQRKTVIKLI